jgi:hypothetical protein
MIPRRWWPNKALLAFGAAVLVLSVAATPAGAHSNTWHKNTYYMTEKAGTNPALHIDFQLPGLKTPTYGSLLIFVIIGPRVMGPCTLHYGAKTVNGRVDFYRGDAWYVYFRKPGVRPVARFEAMCDSVSGGVDRVLSGNTEFRRA